MRDGAREAGLRARWGSTDRRFGARRTTMSTSRLSLVWLANIGGAMPGAGQLERAVAGRILVGCGATLAAASAFGLPWLIGHGPARTLRCVGSAAVRINCLFLAPTEPAL